MMSKVGAGPGLDARIAAEVLGWERTAEGFQAVLRQRPPWSLPLDQVPPFSTDLGAAWMVVEHLKFRALPPFQDRRGNVWIDVLCRPTGYEAVARWHPQGQWSNYVESTIRETAETPPLAICRVALMLPHVQQ